MRPIYLKPIYTIVMWDNSEVDKNIPNNNMLYLTKKNAIAHAKALIKLSWGD
ncbi:MAG: hypothetical protein Q4A69_09300 [Moraxella sp.]|nr:hypothetical protein [Moraxella sp.]